MGFVAGFDFAFAGVGFARDFVVIVSSCEGFGALRMNGSDTIQADSARDNSQDAKRPQHGAGGLGCGDRQG
jgi:hypothetical protein